MAEQPKGVGPHEIKKHIEVRVLSSSSFIGQNTHSLESFFGAVIEHVHLETPTESNRIYPACKDYKELRIQEGMYIHFSVCPIIIPRIVAALSPRE